MPEAPEEWVALECDVSSFRPVEFAAARWLHRETDSDVGRTGWIEDPEFSRGDWERLHDEGYSFCAVVEGESVVARAGVWRRSEGEWEVAAVWTRSVDRNRGLGKVIVSAATAMILDSGRVATLHARADNAAMVNVAKSVGFRPRRAS